MPAMPIQSLKQWDSLKLGVTCCLIYFSVKALDYFGLFFFGVCVCVCVCVCVYMHAFTLESGSRGGKGGEKE